MLVLEDVKKSRFFPLALYPFRGKESSKDIYVCYLEMHIAGCDGIFYQFVNRETGIFISYTVE